MKLYRWHRCLWSNNLLMGYRPFSAIPAGFTRILCDFHGDYCRVHGIVEDPWAFWWDFWGSVGGLVRDSCGFHRIVKDPSGFSWDFLGSFVGFSGNSCGSHGIVKDPSSSWWDLWDFADDPSRSSTILEGSNRLFHLLLRIQTAVT